MMTWNYRVFREESGDYVIREVFYDDNSQILTCTASAVEPIGQTLEHLAAEIEYFREALTLPILTMADIPEATVHQRDHDRSRNISIAQLLKELNDHNISEDPEPHVTVPATSEPE